MNDYCVRESTATVNCEVPHPVRCEPPTTIKGKLQDAKNMLAELVVTMTDTQTQLFGDTSPLDKTGGLDGNCLDEDVNIVVEQARIALAIMHDIRMRLV